MIFGIISYLILTLICDHAFNIKEMIISGLFTKNWFVVSYMMLLLSSPMIEASFINLSNKTLLQWILLLTVLNLYFGYYLNYVNSDGYNMIQFIWLYYIAHYLRTTQRVRLYTQLSRYGVIFFIIGSISLALLYLLFNHIGHTPASQKYFAYNNPLVMVSSLFLFIWFSSIRFKSRFVNVMATGVFGVFLLHTTIYVQPYRNSYTHIVFCQYGYAGVVLESFLLLLFLCLMSIFINKMNISFVKYVNKVLLRLFGNQFPSIN